MKITVGIIGFGTIGTAVLAAWERNASLIAAKTGVTIQVKKVCDLKRRRAQEDIPRNVVFTTRASGVINDPEIDLVVELIGGIHPAKEYILDALRSGKHVVTANKAVLAACGKELFHAAAAAKKIIGFEASVGGGIPLMKNIVQSLSSARIKEVYGILNGTTNYILDQMSKEGADFRAALHQAQAAGYAERNPALDVKGIDSLHKLLIVSYLCFGRWVSPEETVYAEGIEKIAPLDISYADELGYVIKLLAIAKHHDNKLILRVHPALIPKEHLLSGVRGVYNAVYIKTDLNGVLTFYGLGAGGDPTAQAVLADIIEIAKGNGYYKDVLHLERRRAHVPLRSIESLQSSYYIRFTAKDKPGVLSRISTILAEHKISIASVTQKHRSKGQFVPIIMLTHEARESAIHEALAAIDRLALVKPKTQILRIERL